MLAVSTPATLGVLAAGFRIGTGVLLLVNAFQLAWPAFAYSIKDDGEAKRTYAAVMGLYLAFMGWAALSVALLAPWFLRLLTTEPYWGAAAAITPIAIAGPLYGDRRGQASKPQPEAIPEGDTPSVGDDGGE